MPRRTTQLPPDATTLARRLAALEREVRELRASRRASWATIGGGTTTITGARIQTAETGHRVVLDDTDGALKVYNDDGNPTNYLGGSTGVLWNQFGWAGDPNAPTGEWVGMSAGNLLLGIDSYDEWQASFNGPGPYNDPGRLAILAVGWGLALTSPNKGDAGYTHSADLQVLSGKPAGQSGTVDAATVQIDGDLGMYGPIVKLNGFDQTSWRGVPETWHTPSYNTGWSGASSIGSLTVPALRYRQDAEDNLIIEGAFTAASGAGTAVFQLPAGYHPPANSAPIPVLERSGSTLSTTWMYVAGGGNFNLNSQLGSSVTTGAVYSVKAQVPLGNIP